MTVLELVRGNGGTWAAEYAANGGFEQDPDTFHLQFDPETEPVTHAVVRAAAFVHNAEPTQLDPLGRTVDPDALESVLAADAETDYVRVSFAYEDLDVTVDSDGNVWLRWD